MSKDECRKTRRACHGCVSRGECRMRNAECRKRVGRRTPDATGGVRLPALPSCLRASVPSCLAFPPSSLRRFVASSLGNVECRRTNVETAPGARTAIRNRRAAEVLITLSLYHLITAPRGRRIRGLGLARLRQPGAAGPHSSSASDTEVRRYRWRAVAHAPFVPPCLRAFVPLAPCLRALSFPLRRSVASSLRRFRIPNADTVPTQENRPIALSALCTLNSELPCGSGP